ncbi:MAG: hypothetical protein ACP5FH_01070 [Terracidiphilus sp.]
MRYPVFFPLAALLAFTVAAVPQPARAQSGHFILSQHGKLVGSASFDCRATHDGYHSTSLVRVAMKGLDYDISKDERLSPGNQLRRVQLSAVVNGSAVTVAAAPRAAQFLLTIAANGRSTTTYLTRHSAAVFLPDFDPGALENLLTLAALHNNRGLWAIIPKKAGSIEPIQLATYANQKGTLHGKNIVVHHLVATIAGVNTDLFTGPHNQLLQAEFPEPGFALVRKGFVLTPPAKPGAPPPSVPPAGATQQTGAPPAS